MNYFFYLWCIDTLNICLFEVCFGLIWPVGSQRCTVSMGDWQTIINKSKILNEPRYVINPCCPVLDEFIANIK